MNELSLFTGAGGGLLGTMLLGFHPIGYVEWDDRRQRVLAARIRDGILPDAPIFGDIKTFISSGCAELYQGITDIITGGFPCQDISCSGGGRGIEGERSGLWKTMAQTIRIVRPRYVLVENSPMLIIRGLGTVLRDLAEMGFDAQWGVFSASNVGRDIVRERIFIACTSQEHGGQFSRWPNKDIRNLVKHRPVGSPIDRYLEELDWKGEQRSAEGKDCLPPYLCRVGDGVTDELDRLREVGDMQCPQVVATAWRILTNE